MLAIYMDFFLVLFDDPLVQYGMPPHISILNTHTRWSLASYFDSMHSIANWNNRVGPRLSSACPRSYLPLADRPSCSGAAGSRGWDKDAGRSGGEPS